MCVACAGLKRYSRHDSRGTYLAQMSTQHSQGKWASGPFKSAFFSPAARWGGSDPRPLFGCAGVSARTPRSLSPGDRLGRSPGGGRCGCQLRRWRRGRGCPFMNEPPLHANHLHAHGPNARKLCKFLVSSLVAYLLYLYLPTAVATVHSSTDGSRHVVCYIICLWCSEHIELPPF